MEEDDSCPLKLKIGQENLKECPQADPFNRGK